MTPIFPCLKPRLARVLFSWGDQARVECVLSGRTPPDLAVVEGLARLQLAAAAQRRGAADHRHGSRA